MHDQVDSFIAEWQRERPELDATPMGLIGRIARLEQHLSRDLARIFGQFGFLRVVGRNLMCWQVCGGQERPISVAQPPCSIP